MYLYFKKLSLPKKQENFHFFNYSGKNFKISYMFFSDSCYFTFNRYRGLLSHIYPYKREKQDQERKGKNIF